VQIDRIVEKNQGSQLSRLLRRNAGICIKAAYIDSFVQCRQEAVGKTA